MYPETVEQTVNFIKGIGGDIETVADTDVLLVNKELCESLILVHCQSLGDCRYRWLLRFNLERFAVDLSLVVKGLVTKILGKDLGCIR